MSLHTLANHLQSAGRGEDKVLVHMTPGEVSGLQSLAMAHGGSLTINPETGLPEAGFLKSLLPMAIGFGLAPFTGGLSAALITGAGYTAATGSLKKGIMAGLGAYGGAGLASGLSSLGTAAAAPAQAGLSPAVAANTSTAAANNMFANVGAQPLQFTDDILAGVAKTPVTGPGQSVVFNQAGTAITPSPVAPPVAPSVVTNASAYSPASNFNVGQNLSGSMKPPYVTQTGNPYRSIELTGDVVREYAPPGLDPKTVDFNKVGSWRWENGRVVDPRTLSGSPYTPTAPSAVSGYTPSTATTSQPFAGGMQGQYAGPSSATNLTGQASPTSEYMSQLGRGAKTAFSGTDGLKALYNAMPTGSVVASGLTLAEAMKPEAVEPKKDKSLIRPYDFDYGATNVAAEPYSGSAERVYFNPTFTARTPYEAPGPEYAAEGGLMGYAVGGPVEQMSALNSIGANTGYPMASVNTPVYSNPMMQRPEAVNVIAPSVDAGVGAYSGEPRFKVGGLSSLGDYSDGGRLLKGPGDGVSDSIPASIGNRQPARLADGEFVVPARIVSEIGNGSTEAGARKLYAMMDRVQKARRKTVGKGQVARNTKAENLLPA